MKKENNKSDIFGISIIGLMLLIITYGILATVPLSNDSQDLYITATISNDAFGNVEIDSVEAVAKPSTILESLQMAGIFDTLKSGDVQIIARAGDRTASTFVGEMWLFEKKTVSFKLSNVPNYISTYEITLTEDDRVIDTYQGNF